MMLGQERLKRIKTLLVIFKVRTIYLQFLLISLQLISFLDENDQIPQLIYKSLRRPIPQNQMKNKKELFREN